MSISVDLSPFLIKIWDATAGQLKHLQRPKSRVEQLKKARAELRARAADIDGSISLAQLEGKIPSNQIQLWKSEVEELDGKAAAIEQDFEGRRWLASWSWNCFSVNRRVAKRMEEIDKLMAQADATPVATKPLPPAVVHIPTSDSTLAMEAYLKEILGHMASTNAGVIGIYGMGGVGKTTFLRSINNHDATLFDHVIWAVATKECKMERLQMDIAKRLKLHLRKDDNEEDRAEKLFDFLKNKDCLLLLDDMWAPLNLAKLGMVHAPSGEVEQRKRKVVVFTTRDEQVCNGMKASKMMQIKCLEPEQAWELFQRNAGEDAIGSDAGINHIAHQIAKECAGLPLALVTVGAAMSTKKSWEAWNNALTQMKQSELPRVTGKMEKDRMFSAFKLSYDSLENDDLRGCLLSCALWPEAYSIKKDDLIECWMGLGLINEVGTIHKAYNRGHSHIETLKAACLLEPGNDNDKQNVVKMHDVIRDMALWMASDCGVNRFKWIVRTRGAASQALEEKAWHEVERASLMDNDITYLPNQAWHEVERASLMDNDITYLPNQLSTSSKLSVLMLQRNTKLKEIQGSLIQAMCALTYLDLKGARIIKIPKEIGVLSQLQHLNMSSTLIRELPAELGCLLKLKYLFLIRTHDLTTVAKGAISKLPSLKLLDLRVSKYENCLDELKSSKACHISIGIDITTATDLECLCSLAHVSAWRLNVYRRTNSADPNQLFQLLDDLNQPLDDPNQLLDDLKQPLDDPNQHFQLLDDPKLLDVIRTRVIRRSRNIHFQLLDDPKLLDVIRRSRNIRQSLEQLKIDGMNVDNKNVGSINVDKNVGNINVDKLLISGRNAGAGGFECLTHLTLLRLHTVKEITWEGIQPQIVFPNLRELTICLCYMLRNVNWVRQLPSLSVLDISICGMEELISEEYNSDSFSFGLRRLTLKSIGNLKRISRRPLYFPYLEEINVQSCSRLTKLPFDNRIFIKSRLKVIRCEKTWWDSLEWKEISIKNSLSSLVRII